MNRLGYVFLLVVGLGLGACAGGKEEAKADRTAGEPATPRTHQRPGEAKVAASPSALLEKGGARKVQVALEKRGYAVGKSGVIDAKTKEALRSFQKKEKIAATGLPDQLTLQRLDLDPKEILGGYATSKEGELDVEPRKKKR